SGYLDVSVHQVRHHLPIYSEEIILTDRFPHSDIFGSKFDCQLPEAFRRLPRPSSPVIAKASTTCTYSLDPIILKTDLLFIKTSIRYFHSIVILVVLYAQSYPILIFKEQLIDSN